MEAFLLAGLLPKCLPGYSGSKGFIDLTQLWACNQKTNPLGTMCNDGIAFVKNQLPFGLGWGHSRRSHVWCCKSRTGDTRGPLWNLVPLANQLSYYQTSCEISTHIFTSKIFPPSFFSSLCSTSKLSAARKTDLHGTFCTAVWVACVHCCVLTRGFICEVQPGLILKFNCDPFSPEEDAGNSIPGERNRTVMTECTPVVFAHTVVESLINQIKVKRSVCVLRIKDFLQTKRLIHIL